jgi:hypothetical protein
MGQGMQGEISNQIGQILREMLTDEQRINGRNVLRAIEEQHGILVNRHEDIYSFSHLTLQEFLTAKHINANAIAYVNAKTNANTYVYAIANVKISLTSNSLTPTG